MMVIKVLDGEVTLRSVCSEVCREVREIFMTSDLETLHLQLLHSLPQLSVGKDQQTPFHARFYSSFRQDDKVGLLYRRLVGVVASLAKVPTDGSFVFQRIPTFRVHLPDNVATGAFHKDSEYNHPEETLNFIVPLTRMLHRTREYYGNSVMIEYTDQLFYSVGMELGQVLMFSGGEMKHGSLKNDTEFTRVSIDFRIVAKRFLPPIPKLTVNQQRKIEVGDYYEEFEK